MLADAVFLIAIVAIALVTPKGSAYRAINLVLVGEFSLTLAIVGFANLYIDSLVWVDAAKIAKDLMFIGLFYKVGGTMLARVQGWIATYHVALIASALLSTTVLDQSYPYIMGVFCAIQLLCGIRGAVHGVVCSHFIVDSRGNYHRRRHT